MRLYIRKRIKKIINFKSHNFDIDKIKYTIKFLPLKYNTYCVIFMKKEIGVSSVITIIIFASLIGFGYKKYKDNYTDPDISLTPNSVKPGEFADFQVKIEDDSGSITFPDNVFIVHQNQLTNFNHLNFNKKTNEFRVLIPPTLTDFEVIVKSGSHSKTFQIIIEKSTSPIVSGQDYYDIERNLVDSYPGRVTGSENFKNAIIYYETFFSNFGYQTEIQKFKKEENFRQYDVWNLIGYHWGTKFPNNWIVIGGHLDIVDQTYQGAYDNGAGASAVIEIAEAVAKLDTNKTIVFSLWGGEEQDIWGSKYFLENLPNEIIIETYLNLDMPGINWPGRGEFHGYIGPDKDEGKIEHPELLRLLDNAVFDVLKYPQEAFISREQEVGSGDHDSFQDKGIPSVFFFGMTFESWTTNYHTPTDTIEGMELHAGGHDELVGGFNTVAWVVYYIIILLDYDFYI